MYWSIVDEIAVGVVLVMFLTTTLVKTCRRRWRWRWQYVAPPTWTEDDLWWRTWAVVEMLTKYLINSPSTVHNHKGERFRSPSLSSVGACRHRRWSRLWCWCKRREEAKTLAWFDVTLATIDRSYNRRQIDSLMSWSRSKPTRFQTHRVYKQETKIKTAKWGHVPSRP